MKLKIRINELARELEVKPNKILELLPELGVQEKKTHSSSIDEDVALEIKKRFGFSAESENGGRRYSESGGTAVAEEEEELPEEAAPPAELESSAAEPAGPAPPQQAKPEPAQAAATEEPGTPGQTRPALPIRPPLAAGGGPRISAPLRPPVGHQAPGTPVRPRPAQAAPPPPPAATPGAPVRPSAPAAPTAPAGRDVPLFRPGQVIPRPAAQPAAPSSPEQRAGAEARNQPIAPGAPRPAPAPGTPRPPLVRANPPSVPSVPRPPQPPQQPQQSQSGARPNLAGQPTARPVVPPRPDMLARLQQQTRPPVPGAPAPRPPMPGRPASPGQPLVHRGPIRPGQPLVRPGGPGGFGGPGGRPGGTGLRPRSMHPTSPRLEPASPIPATEVQRRMQGRPRATVVEDRRRDAEGKLRPMVSRKEPVAPPPIDREITIGEGVTVKELSEKLGVKTALVIKKLVDRKIFATINQALDVKLAEEISREFGASTNTLSYEEEAAWEIELAEVQEDLVPRAPVVTIMGHVDHGKTSLLDAIRSTNVAGREAGGITQHIGASQIEHKGKKIVFIDTPGHEAFTRMRARGAKVTDIVVLVVAADDGVMPQTLEAIDHARAAKVPIIVAINKIDKPGAQPERIKQQLADRNLLAEDWGGDVVMVPVSAKAATNLDLLLEMILLVAELQNLKANTTRPGIGTVLEAQLDKGRGPVATVLVQNGVLRVGDFFICGQVFGKVRAMFDHLGTGVREAGPSTAVEVLGLDGLPEVGDSFQVVTDTAKAKQIVIYRETKSREQAMSKGSRVTLEQLHQRAKEGDVKDLNVIIKTDVGGTAEVLSDMLQKLSTDKIKIRIVAKNVGAITESDVLLASASNAIVIGFNVRPERTAATLAEKEAVDIRLHTIIYELTDEIKKAMAGLLDPVFKEAFRGRAQVREVFKISKVGTVAGCMVTDGTLTRDSQVRVLRDNVVVHTGRIESLRRFKNDVSEVKTGFECGITIANFGDVKEGDVFEAFAMERVAQEVG
jgi:translation initiation factor IF-2